MTGDASMPSRVVPPVTVRRAATLLRDGRAHERAGRLVDAAAAYRAVIDAADQRLDGRELSEALRRLGAVHRRRDEREAALRLCRESHEVACAIDDPVLAAEALNGIALVHLTAGEWSEARRCLAEALRVGSDAPALRGRIEQNLGIIANIQGELATALAHYQRSLAAFRGAGDEHGCAVAFHNLGMISADQRRWADADAYYQRSLEVADVLGDVNLRGHALLNRTEVLLATARYEAARASVEEALAIFDRLEAKEGKAGAYKFLGMLYRETGAPVLAEARLRTAVALAREAGHTLGEADATRELALVYQQLGRNIDALTHLSAAHRLFHRVDARLDVVDIAGKVRHLEGIYLEVAQQWGRSIESADGYTFGHSTRVAAYAATLAAAMGYEGSERTGIRVGAYLHDLGKVLVPHEILNKPGRLTPEELELIQQHPVFGVEMLAAVEFPWDVKPIIRWHHEHRDGSGYPDRLRGDEIPLPAELICIVDVYDALTTTRSYRGAMSHESAVAEIARTSRWWRREVLEAFQATVGAAAPVG